MYDEEVITYGGGNLIKFLEKSGIKLGSKWYIKLPQMETGIKKKAIQVETKIQEGVKKKKKLDNHKRSSLAKSYP